MTKTPFEDLEARREVGKGPHCEAAFFLATLPVGFALLSILVVPAPAAFVALAYLVPFSAVSLVLLVASALFLQRWVAGEAEDAAVREVTRRSSRRPLPKPARTATDGLDKERQSFKSGVARR